MPVALTVTRHNATTEDFRKIISLLSTFATHYCPVHYGYIRSRASSQQVLRPLLHLQH